MDSYIHGVEKFPALDNNDICYDNLFKEKIVYFYFNLTRKNNIETICEIGKQFHDVLALLKNKMNDGFENGTEYLEIFYRMVGEVRDIFGGKGEHDISYCLLTNLYDVYPTLAIFALHRFVQPLYNDLPFGSWRDIKYFCDFVRVYSDKQENHPLIDVCVELINNQLAKDLHSWKFSVNAFSREHISYVSKWIPRENKKFDWLFKRLAIHWANTNKPYILNTANEDSYLKGLSKVKKMYRKRVSLLNKGLDTTEIKQCALKFYDIQPENVPSYTTMKQNNLVFANSLLTKTCLFDRIKCSQLFKNHYDSIFGKHRVINSFVEKNPLYYTLAHFVKHAVLLRNSSSFYEINALNKQWAALSNGFNKFENMIPLLDISFSMQTDKDSFYFAIGTALLISEKSTYGKRILLMDNLPTWLILEKTTSFIEDIENIMKSVKSNGNTCLDINKTFDLLKLSITQTGATSGFIKSMRFVFISIFGERNNPCKAFDIFKESFLYFKIKPTIIFWNLNQSELFDLSIENSIQTLSGTSYSLLTHLEKKNYKFNKNSNQYEFVISILKKPRYDVLGNYLQSLILTF